MFATYVTCRLQRHRQMLSDYYELLRRVSWKLGNRNNGAKLLANYLSVISENV